MVSFIPGPQGSRLAYVRTAPTPPPPPPGGAAAAPRPRAPGVMFCPGLLSNMEG
jgi:hypothetical protein